MKSVLISIQPKWCELIASGKKTVEVRKTKPKLDVPFKAYIYCTQARKPIKEDGRILLYEDDLAITNRWGRGKQIENPHGCLKEVELLLNGKVIGEFVCDKIYDVTPHHDIPSFCNQYECGWKSGETNACLSFEELNSYLGGKNGYGWHISDLVIYDEPLPLSIFYRKCEKMVCEGCDHLKYQAVNASEYDYDCEYLNGNLPLTKPPQSWCYVEEIEITKSKNRVETVISQQKGNTK